MGNLSCVSCKSSSEKDEVKLGSPYGKPSTPVPTPTPARKVSVGSVSLHDNSAEPSAEEQAEPEKPPIEAHAEAKPSPEVLDEKRLSAWELYDVLQQHRIKEEDDNNLDDIEKAAKAIVDLNVFLASQVIYPAYMKYMEEDHPDLYTQYFCRPSSPTPPRDPLEEEYVHDTSSSSSTATSPCS